MLQGYQPECGLPIFRHNRSLVPRAAPPFEGFPGLETSRFRSRVHQREISSHGGDRGRQAVSQPASDAMKSASKDAGRPYTGDPLRWKDDARVARGEEQFFIRSLRRPQTARPEDLARVEATVHRLSES